jgi:hypothetical protein
VHDHEIHFHVFLQPSCVRLDLRFFLLHHHPFWVSHHLPFWVSHHLPFWVSHHLPFWVSHHLPFWVSILEESPAPFLVEHGNLVPSLGSPLAD